MRGSLTAKVHEYVRYFLFQCTFFFFFCSENFILCLCDKKLFLYIRVILFVFFKFFYVGCIIYCRGSVLNLSQEKEFGVRLFREYGGRGSSLDVFFFLFLFLTDDLQHCKEARTCSSSFTFVP